MPVRLVYEVEGSGREVEGRWIGCLVVGSRRVVVGEGS